MSETSGGVPGGVPAIEGWFELGGADGSSPHLVGSRCADCGTYAFPPRPGPCPNPHCDTTELASVPLSTRGRVWSFTENHYAPPPPYVAAEPFEPYALAAVELEQEGMVVLGQVPSGVRADDLRVGMSMRLAVDVLFTGDDGVDRLVWVWVPDGDASDGGAG